MEVLVGLVLLSIVGAALARLGLGAERAARATQAGAELERSFDTALDFLESDLADAGTDSTGTDLIRLGPDSLVWRATRGMGLACQVGADEVRLLQSQWAGPRLPQAGRDSLMLYAGPDSLTGGPARWLALPILAVTTGTCAGSPALVLRTLLDTILVPPSVLPSLAPARIYEIMQVRLYSSLGAWWFGARSVSAGEAIQPVAGPLAAGGLRFAFLDSAARVTTVPGLVRSISAVVAGSVAGRRDSSGSVFAPNNLTP